MQSRRGIYSLVVVLWLMIWQRLNPRGTMSHAVKQLRQGNGRSLLDDCKRAREGRISSSPSGFCQGVQKLPMLVPQLVTRDVATRLSEQLGEAWPGLEGPVYVVDGTTLLLPHTRKLAQAYPPAENQHGVGHWPIVRMVVLHDVDNGLALYPQWGAAYGPQATSEQQLAAQAFEQVPEGATIIADRNFGVFSVAWEVEQKRRGLIVRLTDVRAKKLYGGAISRVGDYPVSWEASRWDQAQATPWPKGAKLQGRLIAARVGRGKSQKWVYLFTTLSLPAADVLEIYGKRWNIETDLRSLKRTVQLHQLRSRSVVGIEKELLTAICAYNLVRAVMCLAARRSGIPARRLSFTQTLDLINDTWPGLTASTSRQAWEAAFEQLLDWAAAHRLPQRSKRRHYPRAVWGSGYHFPTMKTE